MVASKETAGGLLLSLIGSVGFLWAWKEDKRRKAKCAEAALVSRQARIAQLTRAFGKTDASLTVEGSQGWVTGLLILSAAAGLLYSSTVAQMPWYATAFALVILPMSTVILWQAVVSWGQPVLVLSRNGIKPALGPFVPWQAVEGLYLERLEYRGSVFAHKLHVLMPSLPEVLPEFKPVVRLLYCLRKSKHKEQLEILLKGSSEHPEVVFAIAQQLWKRATQKEAWWSPLAGDEANAESRELARLLRETPASFGNPTRALQTSGELNELATRSLQRFERVRRKNRLLGYLCLALVTIAVMLALMH